MLSNQRPACRQAGQSLVEVVIALGVIVIIISALTFATIASIRNAQAAKSAAQATKLAQEGLEYVRSGRDRNGCISIIGVSSVNSWDGSSTCPQPSGSIWDYTISEDSGCESSAGKCYFNVSSFGALTNIGIFGQPSFPTALAEGIPLSVPVFRRVIILSDDLNNNGNFGDDNPDKAKKVTSVVTWTDFSGTHESRLTTILRKL